MYAETGGRSVAAVVLAGGNADPRLAPGLPSKAFLTIGGRPLVVKVGDAPRGSPFLGRIIGGCSRALEGIFKGEIQVIATDGPQWENILAALTLVRSADLVLAIASDLPLVQSTTIEALVGECSAAAAFYYPFVSRAAIETRFPGARKTYIKLQEGAFCGGCAAVFDPKMAERFRQFAQRWNHVRMRPWRLWTSILGPRMLLRLAVGRLSLSQAETHLPRVTRIPRPALILHSPDLALDVDDEPDLAFARAVLERSPAGPNARSVQEFG